MNQLSPVSFGLHLNAHSHQTLSFFLHFPSSYIISFEYVDSEMNQQSPVSFGLHPNAEIAVKTREGDALFHAVSYQASAN
jgi:hypothetical protein